MASGKLSPRQKMINMMYLVLTAMLALNVSREVMDFLYDDMKSKELSISTIDKQNNNVYNAFTAAASENEEKAGEWRDKAFAVKTKSTELYDNIAAIKLLLVEQAGGTELDSEGNPTDKPKKMDNREKSAEYFIVNGEGENLKVKIDDYRNFMVQQVPENDDIIKSIDQLFNTAPHENKDGVKEDWANHNFEHYPLISILSTLTTIQANIRNSEAQVISELQKKIGASDLKFTGVAVVVDAKSNFVTQGDEYYAEVFLAAYDETQEPKITIDFNGQQLPIEDIVNGKGIVKLPASGVGEKTWGGKIILRQNGEDIPYEIPVTTYNVAPPMVVISPTKMNVLYRNVINPLEISVPGIDPSKVNASGPGVRRSGSGYVADVTKISGKKININVTVTNDDGSTRSMGSKEFRIKGLPQATGLVYKKSNTILSKSATKNVTIEAAYQDFPFELPLTVTSFEVKIAGYPPATVKGTKFDSTTKNRIQKLKPGSTVIVRNIKARTQRGDRVTRISSISIDVN